MSVTTILGIRHWLAERVNEQNRGYSSPCWVWQRSTVTNGYARARPPGGIKQVAVHRVAYEEFVGPISDGLEIDHLCSVRACVNPDHLEAVTRAENMRRGNKPRSHCRNGHPFEGENILTFSSGVRTCRTCSREYFRKRNRAVAG